MPEIRITIRCEKEPSKHAKVLRIQGALGIDMAKMLAGMLDGSSPFYIYKPGPLSPIGKCATCGGELSSTVEEVEAKDAKSEC